MLHSGRIRKEEVGMSNLLEKIQNDALSLSGQERAFLAETDSFLK